VSAPQTLRGIRRRTAPQASSSRSSRAEEEYVRVAMSGATRSHLRSVVASRCPGNHPTPLQREVLRALDFADWSRQIRLELPAQAQRGYRLAERREPEWRIGPWHRLAFAPICEQIPTYSSQNAAALAKPVLVTETVGALLIHRAAILAQPRRRPGDLAILRAIDKADLEGARTVVLLSPLALKLIDVLAHADPSDDVLSALLEQIHAHRNLR